MYQHAISVKVEQFHRLSQPFIEQHLSVLLCDDSQGQGAQHLLAYPDFRPDSFTVADRMDTPAFLAPDERNFEQYVHTMIEGKLACLLREGQIMTGYKLAEMTAHCVDQTLLFLQSDKALAGTILNQEFPWIVNRILASCLFADPKVPLHTHHSFYASAFNVLPRFMELYGEALMTLPLQRLFCLTIVAGLIGFDLKSRGTRRQKIIALQPLLHQPLDHIAHQIWQGLVTLAEPGLLIDDWELFVQEVLQQPCQLLWFVDDYIETFFDLLFITRLLQVNAFLQVTVVAKQGHFENDAAIGDVQEMLSLATFQALAQNRRFTLASTGPSMGTANLRKLAPSVHSLIEQADILFLKGSAVHELFQGGINKICYTAYILAREFNESELGCDERQGPLVFFRTDAGEYAWWGFKGREKRKQRMSDGQEISLCYSTLQEHRRRKAAWKQEDVGREMESLLALQDDEIAQHYWFPWKQELFMLSTQLQRKPACVAREVRH